MGGGNGTGGGTGTGASDDAGSAVEDAGPGPRRLCFNACDSAHPASVTTYDTFSTCYMTTCATECVTSSAPPPTTIVTVTAGGEDASTD